MKVSPLIEWIHKFISLIPKFENHLTNSNINVTIYVKYVTFYATKVTLNYRINHN
jgi:hypothetical protein